MPPAATPLAQDPEPPPFVVSRGARPVGPLVFASPHSGRYYPDDMAPAARVAPGMIRRSEDAYVDRLLQGAPAHGATVIASLYGRAYIDVNREAYELDADMFGEILPEFARARTARVAAGLGSIARVVGEGREIYDRKLTFAEARSRIDRVHRPYHQALAALVEDARAAAGFAVLVDWHSMPSSAVDDRDAGGGADFVLGDRFGASCDPGLVQRVEGVLRGLGWRVSRNVPYAGGHTTEHYGRPEEGIHALQIEINRRIYLDEAITEPKAGMARLVRDLDRLFADLAAYRPTAGA